MRSLVLLFAIFTASAGMMYMGNGGGGHEENEFVRGDWPMRFPKQPAGFDFKCKGRKFGTVTPSPAGPIQNIQRDDPVDVITTEKTTPTTKLTSTTTLKQILTSPTATTFWIRTPTPPNTPAPVVKGEAAFTVGPPQSITVKVIDPFAPDAALAPDAIPSGDLDFGFKTVGTPKAPRKVIDPDA